mgnify:CR=1 FL=1
MSVVYKLGEDCFEFESTYDYDEAIRIFNQLQISDAEIETVLNYNNKIQKLKDRLDEAGIDYE